MGCLSLYMPPLYNCDLHGILNCNVCPCTYPRLLHTHTIIYLASLFVMSVPVHTPNIQHIYYIHAVYRVFQNGFRGCKVHVVWY